MNSGFIEEVKLFLNNTKEGQDILDSLSLGIVNNKVKYMKISAKARGGIFDAYF